MTKPLTILRRKAVEARVGLCRSSIYAAMKKGDFPRNVRLTKGKAVGWIESEIEQFLTEQVERSRV